MTQLNEDMLLSAQRFDPSKVAEGLILTEPTLTEELADGKQILLEGEQPATEE